jgi:hypothetical protein
MAGQSRLKSIGLTLFVVAAFILLVSQSYFSFSPKLPQGGVPENHALDTQEAASENHIAGVLSGDLSFSPKLTQHGYEEGHALDSQEVASGNYLADVISGSKNLHARQAIADDYTCAVGRPCKNGACCGASGNCGYGQ